MAKLLFFVVVFIIWIPLNGTQTAVSQSSSPPHDRFKHYSCVAISFSTEFVENESQNRVYSVSGQMALSPASDYGMTTVSVSRLQTTALNKNYFDDGTLSFADARMNKIHLCSMPSKNGTVINNCTFLTTDGAALLTLDLTFNNDTTDDTSIVEGIIFDRGTVFRTLNGQFFNPQQACIHSEMADSELFDYVARSTICCEKFKEINVTHRQTKETCVEFTSLSTFTPSQSNISAVLSTEYNLYPNHCIDIRSISFTASKNIDFYVQPNENAVTCSSATPYCSQQLLPHRDFQFQFAARITDYQKTTVNGIMGQVIMRNGQVYYDDDKPFTSTDRCRSTTMKSSDKHTYFTSNFCCKKFITTHNLQCTEYQTIIESATSLRLSLIAAISLQPNLILITIQKYYINGAQPVVIQVESFGNNLKLCTFKSSEVGVVCTMTLETGNRYNFTFIFGTTQHQTLVPVFTLSESAPLQWTVDKGENCCNRHPNGNSHYHNTSDLTFLSVPAGNNNQTIVASVSTCCLQSMHHFI